MNKIIKIIKRQLDLFEFAMNHSYPTEFIQGLQKQTMDLGGVLNEISNQKNEFKAKYFSEDKLEELDKSVESFVENNNIEILKYNFYVHKEWNYFVCILEYKDQK